MKKKTGVILSSVAAIAVSASVIAGSTYALFTSEDKVDITVSSANVEVSASVTGATLNRPTSINADTYAVTYAEAGTALSDVSGKEISLDDIQPGDKITLNLLIESESTVNFKYRVSLVKTGGDQNLYENLLVGIDGSYYGDYVSAWTDFSETTEAGKPITVKQSTVEILMPAYLGNEYKNLSCNVALKVEAVQGNVDKTAETGTEKKVYPVYSQDDLTTALAGVGEGETIVVMQKWGEVSFDTDKTNFNVKGCNLGGVTFNAPNATVDYNVAHTDSLNVTAIAGESLHVYGSVGGLEITSGHVVLESSATVNAVTLGENADETVKLDVKEGATINNVAEGVACTTFVSSVDDFVNAVKNNGNLKFTDDVTFTTMTEGDFSNNKIIYIDLNNKTLTGDNKNIATRVKSGEVTYENGTIVAADGTYCTISAGSNVEGKAILNNMKMYNTTAYGMSIKAFANGTIDINDTFVSSVVGGGATAAGGTINIDGDCVFTQTEKYDHNSCNVSASNSGVANIYSGSFTSDNFGVYVYNSGATINIHEGTFTAKIAVLKADKSTSETDSVINVFGGTFDGKFSIANGAFLNIQGGMFKNTGLTLEQFSKYVAEGYTVVEDGEWFKVVAAE